MFQLFWLEVKVCIRRPVWVVLAILSVILFYTASVPDFEPSLTRALTGIPRFPLVSLGEWGRLALLFGCSVVGGIFALFVSLMTMEAFHAELSHQDVLWSMPGAGRLAPTASRVLAIVTFASILIYAGSAAALVNPANRQILVTAGASYIPVYFALTWLQVLVWSSFSVFLLYCTRSRWIVSIIVTVLSGLWYVLGLMYSFSSFAGLLHRSYLAWNFIGPFSPVGLVPEMLALQAASYASLGFLLLGGSLLIRGRLPAWRKVRLPFVRVAVALGLLFVIGTVIGGADVLRKQVAPFRLDDYRLDAEGRLVDRSYADRPYMWSGNGVLLFHPGTHGAVRFFSGEDPPLWIVDIADGRETRFYEGAGTIISRREGASYTPRSQSLVLLYPPDSWYPVELKRKVQRIWEELMPMLNRATVWHDGMDLLVAPPGMGINHAKAVTNGLLISCDGALSVVDLDSVAWALTEPTSLERPERLYLYLYLVSVWDEERVERHLDRLRGAARGDGELPPSNPTHWTAPIPRWDVSWSADMAVRIVDHWEQGQMLGHADYIRLLLKEGSGDSP